VLNRRRACAEATNAAESGIVRHEFRFLERIGLRVWSRRRPAFADLWDPNQFLICVRPQSFFGKGRLTCSRRNGKDQGWLRIRRKGAHRHIQIRTVRRPAWFTILRANQFLGSVFKGEEHCSLHLERSHTRPVPVRRHEAHLKEGRIRSKPVPSVLIRAR
jgi:hypothetical protein